MPDFTPQSLPWIIIALIVAIIWLWQVWQFRLRPMFIPNAEMDAIVDEMIAKHGERAAEKAFIEEDRAWRYSDAYAQGKWRRVKREIERRGNL